MPDKVFGLAQAERLEAGKKRPHWPTVDVLLGILEIPNKVKEEAQIAASNEGENVSFAKENITRVRKADGENVRQAQAQIHEILVNRAAMAAGNQKEIKWQQKVAEASSRKAAYYKKIGERYGAR